MCGLVGIMSSNMLIKHRDALAAMLYLDTWRGRDSTGVAAVRHNADTAVMKATIPGYEFVEGPKLENHLKLNDFLWIGHNRFGTVGKNIKTNAHPFMIDDDDGCCLLVGAHNGTLKNKHVLIDHAKFGTDSEALYNNIAIEGLEDTLAKVEGAWALTYYDHIAEELRIIRNKERPLFYAWSDDKKTFIWASEMWMIRVACSRFDIKLLDDKVTSFNEDTLYSIPAPDKMNEKLVLNRKGGVVGKQAPAFFQWGRHGHWENGRWTGGRTGQPAATTHTQTATQAQGAATRPMTGNYGQQGTPSGTSDSSNGGTQTTTSGGSSSNQSRDNVTSIDDAKRYRGYGGQLISKGELENILDGGCAWCETEHIAVTDKGYGWLAPGKPICAKCLAGEHEDQELFDAIFNQVPKTASVH